MVFRFLDVLKGLVPATQGQGQAVGFPKTLSKSDLGLTADVTVKAGAWTTIGSFRVPAQQSYRIGQGLPNTRNQGYIYMKIMNNATTPAEIKGTVRLIYSDANLYKKQPVFQERNEVLSASKSDINQMKPLPEFICEFREDGKVHEDDYILVEFMPDVDDTVSAANTEILLPVTQYV